MAPDPDPPFELVPYGPDDEGNWHPDVLATVSERAVAYLLDALILSIPLFLWNKHFYDTHSVRTGVVGGHYRFKTVSNELPWWEDLLVLLPGMAALVVPIAVWGGTPGQRLRKLRVLRRRDASAAGWLRSIRRWALFGVPRIVSVVVSATLLPRASFGLLLVASWAWMLWDRNRQALHDKLADVVVVRDPAQPV